MKTVQFRDGKAVHLVKRFSCDQCGTLVTAYMENELDEPTRYLFEEHLAGCEGCERYLAQFHVTVDTLGGLRPEPLPGGMRDRLLSAFRDLRGS